MSAALLDYSCTPHQVGVGTSAPSGGVGMVFTVRNHQAARVILDQIVLDLPQGDGPADLLAPGTTFVAGAVHASDSAAWAAIVSGSQLFLQPAENETAAVEPGGCLQFTLAKLQITAAGPGQAADIVVHEAIHSGPIRTAHIRVDKVRPRFRIEAFSVDQHNVPPGTPVTVSWKVVSALSCAVDAKLLDVGMAAVQGRRLAAVHVQGGGMPSCSGPIGSGPSLESSRTCVIQGATLFTLTARGTGSEGDVTLFSQLLVTVNAPAIRLTGYPPDIAPGDTMTLRWVAADAARLLLYTKAHGTGHTVEDLGAIPVGSRKLTPQVDTSFTLCAFASDDEDEPVAVQQQFQVKVDPAP